MRQSYCDIPIRSAADLHKRIALSTHDERDGFVLGFEGPDLRQEARDDKTLDSSQIGLEILLDLWADGRQQP